MSWVDIENGEGGESVREKLNNLGNGSAPIIGTYTRLFQLLGANMASTADQQFELVIPLLDYVPVMVMAMRASGAITSAVGGIYLGPNKTGIAMVAASQGWSGLNSTTKVLYPVIAAAGQAIHETPPYLSLTTPMGSPGTCDIYILGVRNP